uniref:Adhesion G-protein coupled receptor G5 isoform X10 n=1 Tax=Phascolarctos cinereus TaxID=38626 RepID=A0A6P5IKT7_PHACI|nr:adhesion G-protein coupled receptor G5 isoform X10 [Phascolarctos cinereus]
MMLPKQTFFFLCLLADWSWANEAHRRATNETVEYMKFLETRTFFRKRQDNQRLIHSLEAKLKNANFSSGNVTLQTNNIQSLVFKLTCDFSGLTINSSYLEKAQTRHIMQFPTELTQRACKAREAPQELRLICIYFDMKYFFQDDDNSLLLNDNILGASLVNHSVSSLRQGINISFWHNESLERYDLTCVFWKEGAGKASWGAWSTAGCETILISSYQVLCHCDHLTYFAVLMKLSSTEISMELLAPLTYISIVGCSLSTVASLLTILLHFYSRRILGCFPRTFNLGIIEHSSCLTWMAIEGFNLYLLLVRVYNIYIQRYILKLCAFGWGFPGFVVLLLLLWKSSAYGRYEIQIKTSQENDANSQNTSICWIKSMEIQWVFVMGYAGVTSLFNLVILIWAVKMLHGLHCREKKWESRICRDITTVLGLSVLLGVTWSLPFFSFSDFLLPQLFLSTIFNSLYGFFLFLWFCAQKRHSDLEAETSSSLQMIRTGLQSNHSPLRSPQPSSLTCSASPVPPYGTSHQEGGVEEDMAHPET